MIFLDETWNPDDTRVQAEGRNRQNSATIYYIRTRDTIEEYVYRLNLRKQITNSDLRELRERIHAAQHSFDEELFMAENPKGTAGR